MSALRGLGRFELAAAAVLALCLPWLLLGGLAAAPGQSLVAGHFTVSQVVNFDLVLQGLISEGSLPTSTTLIGAPVGGALTVIGWTYLAVMLPAVAAGAGSMLAFNLALWLHLSLACWFGYLLARRLGAASLPALAAGAFFAVNPWSVQAVMNGQTEQVTHLFLPLLVLLLLRAARTDGLGAALGAALAFGLVMATAVATGPYVGIAAALLVVICSLGLLARAEPDQRRPLLVRLTAAALASVLLTVPFLLYFFGADPGADPLLIPNKAAPFGSAAMPGFNYASVAGWLLPRDLLEQISGQPVLLADLHGHLHYLGWAPLLLAGLALWGRRFRAGQGGDLPLLGARFWALVVLVFGVLAMGYQLVLLPGSDPGIAGHGVPLPLALLHLLLPVAAEHFSVPYRLAIGCYLGLAMLAGLGLSWLAARLPRPLGLALASLLGLLVLWEALWSTALPSPLPVMPFEPPQVYDDLRAMPDGGVVLDIPWRSDREDGPGSRLYPLYRLRHLHPVGVGVDGRIPPHVHGPFHEVVEAWLIDFRSTLDQQGRQAADTSGPIDAPADYFVIHDALLSPNERVLMHGLLLGLAKPIREYPEDGIRLFRSRSFPAYE